jgi:hypothetical protein
VVLQAVVPAETVLRVIPDGVIGTVSGAGEEESFREGEVIVDPYGLKGVKVVERTASNGART